MLLGVLLAVISFWRVTGAQGGTCNGNFIQPIYSIKETDTPGTEILRFSALSNESWSMVIRYGASLDQVRGMLDSYLRMDSLANNTYMLVVNRTLDLEEFPNITLTVLTVILSCDALGKPREDFDVYLFINPVNEYAPEFIDGPYVFNISESQAAGSVLIDLLPHARDRDINLNTDEINGFAVVSYQRNPRNDGAVYFNMTDGHKGQIILGKALDFEQLQAMNSITLWLNVTVTDVSRKSSWTTIQVNVLDDDDLGPEFYHAGCPVLPLKELPCTFGYHVSIPVNFTGNVLSMSPAAIFAHDRDSLNYSIQFGLEDAPVGSGDALNVSSHLELDPVTAEMKVIEPFTETGKFSVNVVATEQSAHNYSVQTTLEIEVFVPLTTRLTSGTTAPPIGSGSGSSSGSGSGSGDNGKNDTDKVVVIGLAVIGALALALVVAVFAIFWVMRKRLPVAGAEPNKPSVPGPSGSEDVKGQDGQTSDNASILTSLPSGRGNKLPPLTTGVQSVGDPDVFDGTRVYENIISPEFFTTPGKTKVSLLPMEYVNSGEKIEVHNP